MQQQNNNPYSNTKGTVKHKAITVPFALYDNIPSNSKSEKRIYGIFRLLRHKLFRTVKIYKYGVVTYDLNFVPFYFDVLRLAALKRKSALAVYDY